MKRELAFTFRSANDWAQLVKWLRHYLKLGMQGNDALEVCIARPSRTKEQNRKLWPILRDISDQVCWPLHSKQKLKPEHWKLIFVSAWREENQFISGINGEPLNLSLSSSELNKGEFSELITLIEAQGAEWGVKWSDPALKVFDEYVEAKRG